MGLAKGADKAVRLDDPEFGESDGITIARILASGINGMEYDLILTGCMSTDNYYSQVGPAVAEFLGIPHAAMVTKIKLDQSRAEVSRELEGGLKSSGPKKSLQENMSFRCQDGRKDKSLVQ